MTSKVVQVKSNVTDPDFPSLQLDHMYLEYKESFGPNRVLFKFVNANTEYISMCKREGLNHEVICLDRTDVLWHEKDWEVPNKTPELSCYYAVKRNRSTRR